MKVGKVQYNQNDKSASSTRTYTLEQQFKKLLFGKGNNFSSNEIANLPGIIAGDHQLGATYNRQ